MAMAEAVLRPDRNDASIEAGPGGCLRDMTEPTLRLAIRTTNDSSFAVVDARSNRVLRDGFATWQQAGELVEAIYLRRETIKPHQSNNQRVASGCHRPAPTVW